jgi:hypothetical protein
MSAIEKLLSLAHTLGAMPYYALRKITMLSKRIPLYTQIKINKYKRLGNPVIRHQIDLRQAFLWLGLGTILSHPLQGLAQPSAITLQQLIAQNAIDEWISFNAPNRPMVQSLDDVSRLEKNPMEYRKCLRINQFWAAVPANNVKPPRGDSCALNIPPTPQGKGQARKWDIFLGQQHLFLSSCKSQGQATHLSVAVAMQRILLILSRTRILLTILFGDIALMREGLKSGT